MGVGVMNCSLAPLTTRVQKRPFQADTIPRPDAMCCPRGFTYLHFGLKSCSHRGTLWFLVYFLLSQGSGCHCVFYLYLKLKRRSFIFSRMWFSFFPHYLLNIRCCAKLFLRYWNGQRLFGAGGKLRGGASGSSTGALLASGRFV